MLGVAAIVLVVEVSAWNVRNRPSNALMASEIQLNRPWSYVVVRVLALSIVVVANATCHPSVSFVCVCVACVPAAVLGTWTGWQPVGGACTVTCGGGWLFLKRQCTPPAGATGPHICRGASSNKIECNTSDC